MKALKPPATPSRSNKQDREYKVLLGLVAYYLKTGKPVGSHTLKEAGFEDLSSATIRNYFASLEEAGYLSQQHASGGRIPTHRAYRAYANEHIAATAVPDYAIESLQALRQAETREMATYLQQAAETLSSLTHMAVFLSAPRFDQDFIVGLKLVPIDSNRCLCVIITDFGIVQTETLYIDTKLSAFAVKRIEAYFHWRLTDLDRPENMDKAEELLAQKIYNEIMIRYIVGYSNFVDTQLYRTGLSRLLAYPDFHDASALANSLALFENAHQMRLLIKECCKFDQLKCWIGDDLANDSSSTPNCTVIAIPYQISHNNVGAVGLLGPTRIPYPELFGIMREFASSIGEAIARNLLKFKITFRQPHAEPYALEQNEYRLISPTEQILIENKEHESHG